MRTLLLVFAFACAAIGQTTKCPGPYHAVGTGCYLFPEMTHSSWTFASALCQFSGGYLANIESKAEQVDLFEYQYVNYPGDFSYWIGVTDMITNGTWRLVPSGATLVYENWGPGQPSYYDYYYDCAYWYPSYNDAWYAYGCCNNAIAIKPLCEADPL